DVRGQRTMEVSQTVRMDDHAHDHEQSEVAGVEVEGAGDPPRVRVPRFGRAVLDGRLVEEHVSWRYVEGVDRGAFGDRIGQEGHRPGDLHGQRRVVVVLVMAQAGVVDG